MLAGGTSRRFGSDKLSHALQGRSLLDLALDGLPADVDVIVVGPERATSRSVRFVRESPVGGGPAAALVAGLRAALSLAEQPIAVLPADAPQAAAGASVLVRRLTNPAPAPAVVAVDAAGREQPLQLALATGAARALVANAGPEGAAGASARRLLHTLDPPPVPQALVPVELFDIDTIEQLVAWQLHTAPVVTSILDAVAAVPATAGPTVIALDGPSGTGKSTLASALRLRSGATILSADDFHRSDLASLTSAQRNAMSDAEVADGLLDWSRLRTEALEPLIQRLPPADIIVLDGVYSARAELADLVDVAVYVEVDRAISTARLHRRGGRSEWAAFRLRGESHYFSARRPPASFDLRVSGDIYATRALRK